MARSKSLPRKSAKRRPIRRRVSPKKRKRPTTRNTDVRPRKKVVKASSNTAHHAVRMNPFSSATAQPKIPDGILTSSLSRRCQNVLEIQNANGTLGQQIMHIFFAPTLGVPLTVLNSVGGFLKRSTSPVQPQFVGFPGQSIGFNTIQGGPKFPANAGQNVVLQNQCGFSKWRVVSQGLRMELNNTAEEDDGWFEVCRFNWNRNPETLCLVPIDGSTTDTTLGYAPEPVSLWSEYSSMAMVEQPGYKTGVLKDLKNLEFKLLPQSATHEPVNLSDKIEMVDGTDLFFDTTEKTYDHRATAPSVQSMNQGCDPNMDWIYIRLHCRTNNGNSSNGSKLITNVIQSLEMAYTPDSDFATFQTINKLDPKTSKVADQMNNNLDGFHRRRK